MSLSREYDTLKVSADEKILIITINREDKLNALNQHLIRELHDVIADFEMNNQFASAILTGSGSKAFAAGADISEFADFNVSEGKEMARNGHGVFNALEQCSKPIIAAVNGFALGGGCELAMACHMRVASENARFGQPEVNLGIIPGYGGTQRLIQYIGKSKATELLMTGDMIKAEEAHRLGLVNHVVPQEELLNKCKEILQKVMAKAPLAIGKIIQCVNAYYEEAANGFEVEIEQFGESMNTNDFKEGTKAFLEKRKPEFTGF